MSTEQLMALLPQFDQIELIGRGGMGVVYKARQRNLDRPVALKVLLPEVAGSPGFAERFAREARSMARLSHPNIVAVYDFGSVQNSGVEFCYFTMEYVEGSNLRGLLKKLSSAQALAIVPQICEALQYAHDIGIVHRDIKPENILVDKKGRVRIADFGLAKLLQTARSPSDYTLTHADLVMGTPSYMAPEQMERPNEVDHRADLYSLGVVFYEMLTGQLPKGRFLLPSQRVRVDVRFDEIVLKTLEHDRELRYQHASEVQTSVETVRNTMSPTVTPAQRHAAIQRYPFSLKVLAILSGAILLLSLLWLGRNALRENPHTTLKRTATESPEPTRTTSSPTASSVGAAGPATAPDLSEPLGLLRAWCDALGADDFPTAEALCVGPKETLRLMEVDSQQGLELVRLNDAMRQVFAGQNPNIASGPTAQAREAFRQMLLQATVLKTDPDLATAYPSSANKMILRRIDGQWKLDFAASYLPADYQPKPGDFALERGFYLLPVQRLTQDVLAGKFKTLDEAMAAYNQLRGDWKRIPNPLRDDVTRKQAGEVAGRYWPSTTQPAATQSAGPSTRP